MSSRSSADPKGSDEESDEASDGESDEGSDGESDEDAQVDDDGLDSDENERVKNIWDKILPKPAKSKSVPISPSRRRFSRIKTPDSSDEEDLDITQKLSCPITIPVNKVSGATPSISDAESSASEDIVAISDGSGSDTDKEVPHCSTHKEKEQYPDNGHRKSGFESTATRDDDSEPDTEEEDPDFAPNDDKINLSSPVNVVTRQKEAEAGGDENEGSLPTQVVDPTAASSSESESDAENDINVTLPLTLLNEETPDSDVVVDPVNWALIPILDEVRYRDYTKYIEIGVHNSAQFYVQIHTKHASTSGMKYMYPREVVDKFQQLNVPDRNYAEDKFIFKLKDALYKDVRRILRDSEAGFQYEVADDNMLSNVIQALAKYNLIQNQKNQNLARKLVDKNLAKYARFHELHEYQMESIVFSVTRSGRCILADEYRMGKGVEAIYASAIFEQEWPLLILCRAPLQEQWKLELEKWLQLDCRANFSIKVLTTVEDCTELESLPLDARPEIAILGYNLLQTPEAQSLKNLKYRVLIIDESHRIKHPDTKTSQAAQHFIKRAKRRFLLTSNPAFGVPLELFRQLHAVDRVAFDQYRTFAQRYCGFEMIPDGSGGEKEVPSRNWRTARNLEELRHLLFGTVLIRHFRQDYIEQKKEREVIKLEFNPDTRTQRILETLYKKHNVNQETLNSWEPDHSSKSTFKWYKKSGQAKLAMICKYLDQLDMKNGKKILIYGRHKFVLEGIELLLKRKGISYRRLEKDYDTRQKQCDEFNKVKSVKVALLSMTLSDVCLDLSAAEMIIFTELFWVPDALIKNEDRAFGEYLSISNSVIQKSVSIKYLLARESPQNNSSVHIDDYLWDCLLGKMDVLNKLGFMKDDFMKNVPEKRFIPSISTTVDDLDFGDMSSGADSGEEEYVPSSGDDGEDDDDDGSSGVEEVSEDSDGSSSSKISDSSQGALLVVDSSSESDTEPAQAAENGRASSYRSGSESDDRPLPAARSPRTIKREHSPSESSSSVKTASDQESDKSNDAPPKGRKKPATRLTRSQAKKKKISRKGGSSDSVSKSSASESGDSELQTCFPANRDSDDASECGSSIDSFIDDDGSDSDASSDDGVRRGRKSIRTKRTKRGKKQCNKRDNSDSSDTDDSYKREKKIKKKVKSLFMQ